MTQFLVEQAAETVRERQKSYNHPRKNFADIAKCWSTIVGVEITSEQVALMMIMMKCLRENFKHQDDNIIDIGGYAICLEQILRPVTQEEINQTAESEMQSKRDLYVDFDHEQQLVNELLQAYAENKKKKYQEPEEDYRDHIPFNPPEYRYGNGQS